MSPARRWPRKQPAFVPTITRLAVILLGTLAGWSCDGKPVEVDTVALPPASGIVAAEFSTLPSVAELADGRVLLTDGKENRLLVADLVARTASAVGQVGNGPSEYLGAGDLYRVGPDSVLMYDGINGGAWLLLRDDRIVGPLGTSAPTILANRLVASNSRGGILAISTSGSLSVMVMGGTGRAAAEADSALVLVGNLNNPQVDTIGKLGQVSITLSGSFPLRIPSDDIAALFEDGWVALIRNTPYRVDWRSPAGVVTIGPVLSSPVQWNEEDQRLYLSRRSRLVGVEAIDGKEISGWPKTRPSLMSGWSPGVVPLPDGKLLIQRMPESTRAGTNYDVIDRNGVRVAVLSLPENEFIVTSGRKAVYVSAIDESGIQRVRRHPWP